VYEASSRKRDSKASSEIKERGHKICQIVRYALRHNYTPTTWSPHLIREKSKIRDVHAFRVSTVGYWVVVLVHLRHTFANIFWYGIAACPPSFCERKIILSAAGECIYRRRLLSIIWFILLVVEILTFYKYQTMINFSPPLLVATHDSATGGNEQLPKPPNPNPANQLLGLYFWVRFFSLNPLPAPLWALPAKTSLRFSLSVNHPFERCFQSFDHSGWPMVTHLRRLDRSNIKLACDLASLKRRVEIRCSTQVFHVKRNRQRTSLLF